MTVAQEIVPATGELALPSEPPWTEEELRDLLRIEPMSGAEAIAAGLVGGWEGA